MPMNLYTVKLKVFFHHLFSNKPRTTYWQRARLIVGPATKEEFNKTGQKETRNAIEEFILNHSTKKTTLLDAGCNTAIEGYRLFKKGYKGHYTGVDSNSKAIQYAQYNLNEFKNYSLFVSDLDKLYFKHKQFDIVLMKDVIEHQQHYRNVLSEATRVAKKYFVLGLFITLSESAKDKIKLHPDGYYLNKYAKQPLLKFMAECGFKTPQTIYQDKQDEILIFERK